MGFAHSSFKILQYNRNLLHKRSYFKSRDVSQFSLNLAKAERRKFSNEALSRIKQQQKKHILKSLILGVVLAGLTVLALWYFLL